MITKIKMTFLPNLLSILFLIQPLFAQTIKGSTLSFGSAQDDSNTSTTLSVRPESNRRTKDGELVESRSRRVDKIIAVVNNEVILQTDVDRVLATIEAEYRTIYSDSQELAQKLKQTKKNIINQMVEEKLVLSEAKKYDIEIDEDKIEARIEQIKKSFPSEEAFGQALAVQGLRLKELRDRFSDQEIMKNAVDYFVRSEIEIDPREIRLFFQSHQEELFHPERAKVKSILIKVDESRDEPFDSAQDGSKSGALRQAQGASKGAEHSRSKPVEPYETLQKAKMILERLKKGEDFETLAKVYSQGASASDGGSLGFIEKGQLINEIDEAVFKLEPGEFSDVIKTSQHYRIFKVEEKEPKRLLSFSEAQDSIRDILYRKKFAEAFKKWIDELKQNAYISINIEPSGAEIRE